MWQMASFCALANGMFSHWKRSHVLRTNRTEFERKTRSFEQWQRSKIMMAILGASHTNTGYVYDVLCRFIKMYMVSVLVRAWVQIDQTSREWGGLLKCRKVNMTWDMRATFVDSHRQNSILGNLGNRSVTMRSNRKCDTESVDGYHELDWRAKKQAHLIT